MFSHCSHSSRCFGMSAFSVPCIVIPRLCGCRHSFGTQQKHVSRNEPNQMLWSRQCCGRVDMTLSCSDCRASTRQCSNVWLSYQHLTHADTSEHSSSLSISKYAWGWARCENRTNANCKPIGGCCLVLDDALCVSCSVEHRNQWDVHICYSHIDCWLYFKLIISIVFLMRISAGSLLRTIWIDMSINANISGL